MSNKFDPLFPNNEKERAPKLESPTYNNISSEILCLLPPNLADKLIGQKLSEILKVVTADEKILDDISSLPPEERVHLIMKNISNIKQKQDSVNKRERLLSLLPLEIRNKNKDNSLENIMMVLEKRKNILLDNLKKNEQKIALEKEIGAENGLADKYVNNPDISQDLSGDLVIHASSRQIKDKFIAEAGDGLFYSDDFGHIYDKGGLKKNHFLYILRKANEDKCIDQVHGWYKAQGKKEIEDLIILPEVKKGDVKSEEKFQKILKILRAQGAQASGMEYKG